MDLFIHALLDAGPRFVSEYMAIFGSALATEFNLEDPGRNDKSYLMGIYVGKTNKRHIVIYIGIGRSRDHIQYITRVDYTLALPPEYGHLYNQQLEETLPAEGPTFRRLAVAEGQTSNSVMIADVTAENASADPTRHLALWDSEIVRIREVLSREVAGSTRRRAIRDLLRFWSKMKYMIEIEISRAEIFMEGEHSPRSPPLRVTRRHRAAASNVTLPVSSSSTPRILRRARTRRAAAAAAAARSSSSRKTNSDPRQRRLPRDPVTGKIIRRRQPYSDPRSSSINLPERSSSSGRRSGYEGNSNSASRYSSSNRSTPPPAPPSPGVFSHRRRSSTPRSA